MCVENLAQGKFNVFPCRPKFSWDSKNVPWTDVCGPENGYAESFELWSSFYDLLDDSNPNKISSRLRRIFLQFQLFCRARVQARNIDKNPLHSSSGAEALVAAIFKRDPLSVISAVHANFNALINAQRATNEYFKSFEVQFDALVCRFKTPRCLLFLSRTTYSSPTSERYKCRRQSTRQHFGRLRESKTSVNQRATLQRIAYLSKPYATNLSPM